MNGISQAYTQRIKHVLPFATTIEGGHQTGKDAKQDKAKEYQPAFRHTSQKKHKSQYSKRKGVDNPVDNPVD